MSHNFAQYSKHFCPLPWLSKEYLKQSNWFSLEYNEFFHKGIVVDRLKLSLQRMYEILEMMGVITGLEDKQDMDQRAVVIKLEWGDEWLGNHADIWYNRWRDVVFKLIEDVNHLDNRSFSFGFIADGWSAKEMNIVLDRFIEDQAIMCYLIMLVQIL